MVRGALSKILKDVLPDRNTLNYVTLDMTESSLSDLAAECSFLPLGESKKCVVADDCSFLLVGSGSGKGRSRKKVDTGSQAFLEYLAAPDDSILLFLLCYGEELDQKSELFLALKAAHATFSPVAVFTPGQWSTFIPRFFEKRGYSIDSMAISELSNRIAGDYALFLSEAQKLIAYCQESKKVETEDIRALVAEPLEEDSFHLSNALLAGDNRKAIRTYRDLKMKSVDEVSLIRLLGNQFRFLNEVRYLRDKGIPSEEIARLLFASSGRVNASLNNLRRMGDETLNKGLESLYQCELSIMTGKMTQELAFTLFLATWSL